MPFDLDAATAKAQQRKPFVFTASGKRYTIPRVGQLPFGMLRDYERRAAEPGADEYEVMIQLIESVCPDAVADGVFEGAPVEVLGELLIEWRGFGDDDDTEGDGETAGKSVERSSPTPASTTPPPQILPLEESTSTT